LKMLKEVDYEELLIEERPNPPNNSLPQLIKGYLSMTKFVWVGFVLAIIIVSIFITLVILQSRNTPQEDSSSTKNPRTLKPTVILISFDGFRSDYLDDYAQYIPTITNLIKNGSQSRICDSHIPYIHFSESLQYCNWIVPRIKRHNWK